MYSIFAVNKYLHTVASVGFLFILKLFCVVSFVVRVVSNLTLDQSFTEPLPNSDPWRTYHFPRLPIFFLPKVRPKIGRYRTPQGQNFSPESRKIFLFAVLHDIRKNIALFPGFTRVFL